MTKRDKTPKKWARWLGPGLVTGASDDDPAGIGTYSQAGARFGYGMLWTMPFALPLMSAVQILAARLGRTSGHGIAHNLRRRYPAPVGWAVVGLLVAANVFNLGADLAIMGAAAALLAPGPGWAYSVLFAVGGFVALGLLRYEPYSRFLRLLVVSLFAYVLTAFVVRIDWGQALAQTVLPRIQVDGGFWAMVVAILGTTLSPYMFFWQASHEVEEARNHREPPLKKDTASAPEEGLRIGFDTLGGMTLSNVVAFFIIVTCAATLNQQGIVDIEGADQAAQALRPLAGDLAFTLFALGIVGTGLLAVPVLGGSAAFAVAELLGWPHSLDKRFWQAGRFFALLGGFFLGGLVVPFLGLNVIDALVLSATINGVVAVPILFFMLRLGMDRQVMGSVSVPRTVRWLVAATILVLTGCVVAMVWTSLA